LLRSPRREGFKNPLAAGESVRLETLDTDEMAKRRCSSAPAADRGDREPVAGRWAGRRGLDLAGLGWRDGGNCR